jgi:hypothetical protein
MVPASVTAGGNFSMPWYATFAIASFNVEFHTALVSSNHDIDRLANKK